MASATTILLYSRTNGGKTTQLGVLAEDVYKKTGKKTRMYVADRGGIDPIRPYVDLGVIEIVPIGNSNIWIFTNRAATGHIRDAGGKWVLDKDRNSQIGMYAFESAHSIAQLMQADMEKNAGTGTVLGGDANTSFTIGGDGETLRVGSQKGYGKYTIPQARIYEEMMASQLLDAEYVVWTAGVSKDDDEVSSTKIIGPDIIGRALTGLLSKDFNYTIRLDVLPAQGGKPERHLLYLGNNTDVNAGNASALGNIRRPLDAPPLTTTVVEPANIVKALDIIRHDAVKAATEVVRKRMGIKVEVPITK